MRLMDKIGFMFTYRLINKNEGHAVGFLGAPLIEKTSSSIPTTSFNTPPTFSLSLLLDIAIHKQQLAGKLHSKCAADHAQTPHTQNY